MSGQLDSPDLKTVISISVSETQVVTSRTFKNQKKEILCRKIKNLNKP